MLIKRVAVENVRSFLVRQELKLDGLISIIIGPNGGGKTNLLDAIFIVLRRNLFASRHFVRQDAGNNKFVWGIEENPALNSIVLERHSSSYAETPQIVEVEIQVTESDVSAMARLKAESSDLVARSEREFTHNPWQVADEWNVDAITAGTRFTYRWNGNALDPDESPAAQHFREFLQLFELDNNQRAELGSAPLQMPMIYLPVNRTSSMGSSVRLVDYNVIDQKKQVDAISSRNPANLMQMAVGRLGRKLRDFETATAINSDEAFKNDPAVAALTRDLESIGYNWSLKTIDRYSNTYDIELSKQGVTFSVTAASSGEREILTYLFAIHALNVRDALIVVDEPELHLHPKWQSALFRVFERLAEQTGNQFVMATHSPSFITPSSIQYVSRVYSESKQSRITRLSSETLPRRKHLFATVNTQNNERIFFADHVLLVEGAHDQMVFERILDLRGRDDPASSRGVVEVVRVDGKGLFPAYSELLSACGVAHSIVADLDYLKQIGDETVKPLFMLDPLALKKGVIEDPASIDGQSLVQAIDRAMTDRGWTDAIDIWEYIKSRRTKLKPELDEADKKILSDFLRARREEGIFVLSRGELEDYLPIGCRGKDTEKLIELVSAERFWENLPEEPRAELEMIADIILAKS